ncbi:peptide ABC transporter substrate-binding protein [Ornithinimicrobium cavernae]|uniref:peptide ABC transporter substrate-binding protein n=1 Tax=Ornithinimicrobium cavernae TaxID=2666047 RepID=UPI000D695E02|nr:ABC transporter substrate-binding protein [Ornithinimicrobium cavernae]
MTTSTRRTRAALALAATATLLLAACSDEGAAEPAAEGGTFSVASSDPQHLTPGNSWAAKEMMLLFAPPLAINDQTGEFEPHAAKSVTSEDQQTWTIELQEGWTFHNGEPVTAQNYADAWNAAALGANAYVQNNAFAMIEGYDELNPSEGTATTDTLSGVQVVDEDTLEVTLSKPYGLFPYLTTNWAFAPLPEEAFEDPEAFDKAPIGNGPYAIKGDYAVNQPLELVRYDNYGGEPALAQGITFVPYTDMGTAYNDLLAGNVDVVYPVPGDRLGDANQRLEGRTAASSIPNLNYFGFPLWEDQFSDARVRKAFSMAIDRETLTSSILRDAGVPATSIAPESAAGNQQDACAACVYDPEGAKALLEEAGGWEGDLVLWAYQDPATDQLLQAIANQLRTNLGIEEITFQVQPWAQFAEAVAGHETGGPYLAYWGAFFPHVAAFLEPVVSATGTSNDNDYANDEFNALMEKADGLDFEQSQAIYQEAERLLWEDMPIMPVYHGLYTAAWSERLADVPVGLAGLGDLTTVQVTN